VNIQAKTSPVKAISPAEWQARVDLAAVYRLVAHHGWDDVIFIRRGSRHVRTRAGIFAPSDSAEIRASIDFLRLCP
jgi:hypothetical protein